MVFRLSSSVCYRSSEVCRTFLYANSLWFWWGFRFFQPLSRGARRSCTCLRTEALLIPDQWVTVIRFLSLVLVHEGVKLGLNLKTSPYRCWYIFVNFNFCASDMNYYLPHPNILRLHVFSAFRYCISLILERTIILSLNKETITIWNMTQITFIP